VPASAAPPRAPAAEARTAAGPTAALAAAVLAFFVITLDATIVNVALPSIRGDLGGGITGLQWVVDGYTLMFAALLLSAGALSDRVGAERALAAGLVVFLAASLACGLAPGLGVLVAARFVQGASAAVIAPASMALIRHAYDDAAARARAVGMWAMGGAVAAAAGPVLGGLLSLASWRWIFFINLPVGAVTLLLLARAARSPHHAHPFDWAGQAAAIAAMGGLTYGAIEAGVAGFTAPPGRGRLRDRRDRAGGLRCHRGTSGRGVRRAAGSPGDVHARPAGQPAAGRRGRAGRGSGEFPAERSCSRKAAQGNDLILPLDQVAEGYRAMDERRAIKSLLMP
jgi:hypothetical protein